MSLVFTNSIHFMSQLLTDIVIREIDEQKCSEIVQHARHFGLKMDQVLNCSVKEQRLWRVCAFTRAFAKH